MATTTATVLTPAGRGAVASILVRGPAACAMVDKHFHPAVRRPLSDFRVGRIVFGRWGASPGEEIVVCRQASGDVELHCHGGQAASDRILSDLTGAGCLVAAFASAAEDGVPLLQREALAALMQARTERTASILLDQYQGALEHECHALQDSLAEARWAETSQRLHRLLSWSTLGLHLVSSWKVVLAGRPNVGKSSLINALLGYERAIVFNQPGTTRDAVTTETALEGWPVEVSDTAGLRSTVDELELAGIDQARRQVGQADCLVLVFDASANWTEDEQRLLTSYPGAIVVHNKADLAMDDQRPAGIRTAAIDRAGISDLIAAVAERLVPVAPLPGMPVPFSKRQVAWLQATQQAVAIGEPHLVAACLRQLMTAEQMPKT